MSAFDRAFDRQPGESDKAFEAYKIYRDLGPGRSLVKAAEIYYGSSRNLAQLKVWSGKFSWVDRAAAYEDWKELIRREAVQDHLESEAEDIAQRRAALEKGQVEIAELANEQVKRMLRWSLIEQTVVEENERGEPTTLIFSPARWTKSTPLALHTLMRNALSGQITEEDQQLALAFDPSELTEEEAKVHLSLLNKGMIVPYNPPEEEDQDHPPR